MTPEHLERMAAGRREAQDRRERAAVQAVRDFRRWLTEGSRKGTMPRAPSDAQYAMARRHGEPRSVLDR